MCVDVEKSEVALNIDDFSSASSCQQRAAKYLHAAVTRSGLMGALNVHMLIWCCPLEPERRKKKYLRRTVSELTGGPKIGVTPSGGRCWRVENKFSSSCVSRRRFSLSLGSKWWLRWWIDAVILLGRVLKIGSSAFVGEWKGCAMRREGNSVFDILDLGSNNGCVFVWMFIFAWQEEFRVVVSLGHRMDCLDGYAF